MTYTVVVAIIIIQNVSPLLIKLFSQFKMQHETASLNMAFHWHQSTSHNQPINRDSNVHI